MKLTITDTSPFGARVRMTAAFTGAHFEEAPPPGGAGSEEMKSVSIFGKLPALETDGRMLIESIPLMEFVVDLAGGSPLVPTAPVDRAAMRSLMVAHDNHVLGAIWPCFVQLRTGKPDPAICVAALEAGRAQYERLTDLFDEGDFALFDTVTLADLTIAPFAVALGRVYGMFKVESPFAAIPRLARWWGKVSTLPEVAGVVETMTAAAQRAAAAAAQKAQ